MKRLKLCFFSTWGRVWVHHLSLSSGHLWNSDGRWLSCPIPWSIKTVNSVYPESIMIQSFAFIYICQQIEKTGLATAGMAISSGSHCSLLFWQCLNSSSGGELKLYLGCKGSTFSFVQVLFDRIPTLYADILEDTKHWSNCLHSVFTNQVRDSMNPFVQFTTAILWQFVFFVTSITTVKVILYLAFAKN